MAFLTVYPSSIIAQDNLINKDIIFLVDLSGSIRKDNLFQKVKDVLNSTVNSSVTVGDNVTIMGFDSKVYLFAEKHINNISDKFALNGIVSSLEAKGQWTYLTNALEIAAQKIDKLMTENPKKIKLLYLLTDGKNDPPPNIKNPITYQDLIDKYFKVWTAKNSFTYIFKFGVNGVDTAQENFIKKINPIVGDINRLEFSIAALIPQRIEKTLKSDAKEIQDTIKLSVGVSYLKEPISFKLSSSKDLTLEESNFRIDSTGQSFNIPVKLSNNSGLNTLKEKLAVNFKKGKSYIVPDTIDITYNLNNKYVSNTEGNIINESNEADFTWLYIAAGVILLIALLLLICKVLVPKFPSNMELIIEDNKSKNILGNYTLEDFKKFCSSSVTIGENRDVDIELEGTILRLSPARAGVKVKVINGQVWDQMEMDENLYTDGKSYTASYDSDILTNSKKIRFNIEEDVELDDLDDLDEK